MQVDLCSNCGKVGVGLQIKNGKCKQCRYKDSGSSKPYKIFS